jgi:hypothetical protein
MPASSKFVVVEEWIPRDENVYRAGTDSWKPTVNS